VTTHGAWRNNLKTKKQHTCKMVLVFVVAISF